MSYSLLELIGYSLSSLGLLSLVYRAFRCIRAQHISDTYFKDKVVLITGASQGLGRSLAEEFYALGAQVIICARNNEELLKLKNSLMTKPGKEPEILNLDVSVKVDVIQPKIEALIKKFNRIDILINNAGVSYRGDSIACREETLEKIMNTNFFGAVRLTRLIVQHMIDEDEKNKQAKLRRRNYSIVNVGSVQSYLAIPYRSAYTASKHALLAYSDSLRAELFMHKNIDVIQVQPGYINTNVSINALTSEGQSNSQNDDDHKKGYEPKYVAQVIIRSIINRDKEVFCSVLLHRLGVWLRFFFPNVYFWAMYRRAKETLEKKFQ